MDNSLEIVGQNIMDLYYQQFKSDEDFFEDYHFNYLAAVVYAQLMQEKYEQSYKLSLAETGRGEAQLNPEWFIPEDVDVVASELGDKELILKSCPFSFMYDKQSSGIQGVYQLAGKCGEFIRITMDDQWKIKNLPSTNIVFWYPFGNKIIFKNIQCGLKKVKVLYIPSLKELDGTCRFPQTLEAETIQRVLQMMYVARNGTVVDMTSNQNPNKVIETELANIFKRLNRG